MLVEKPKETDSDTYKQLYRIWKEGQKEQRIAKEWRDSGYDFCRK